MTNTNYKCNRIYRIWIYAVSHCTLVIRSERQYPDVDYIKKYDCPDMTIDLIFTGVKFISIPEKFDELELVKRGDRYYFNDNEDWYVDASSCVIGKYLGEDEDDIWIGELEYDELIKI